MCKYELFIDILMCAFFGSDVNAWNPTDTSMFGAPASGDIPEPEIQMHDEHDIADTIDPAILDAPEEGEGAE